MIVTLNGQTMDLTFENERTVAELLMPLNRWLEDGGMSLASFSLDGIAVGDDSFVSACSRELSGISTLDAVAHPRTDLLREALAESETALSAALSGSENRSTALKSWEQGPAAAFLARSEATLGALIRQALGESGPDAAKTESALSLVRERTREAADPLGEMRNLCTGMSPLVDRLEELPLDLQTGKDGKAAATLRDFALMAEKLLRIVPLLRFEGMDIHSLSVGETDFRSFVEELDAALRELVAAYESGDAVLVGDLSEYEIAPRLRALASAMGPLATK